MLITLMTRFDCTRALLVSLMVICVLASSLAIPASALAAQVSNVGKKVAAPWFDNSVPWDGQWGAFNQDTSEAASGACLLTPRQISQAKSVIDVLQDDFRNIENGSWSSDKKSQIFKDSVDERIKSGNPAPELVNSAIIKAKGGNDVDPPAGKPKTGGRWELGDSSIRRLFPKGNDLKRGTFPDFFRALTANKKISGCNFGNKSLKSLLTLITPNFTDIFKEPAGFIARIFMFLPCLVAYGIWEVVGGIALQATFTTPHSERGDTIVDTISAERKISRGVQSRCTAERGCSYAETRIVCKNVRTTTGSASQPAARSRKTLQKGENVAQLGFKCSNALSVKKQQSNVWIAIAKAFRNILSALYGVIVIAIALMYLFRRDPGSAYDVKIVLPKVLVAVVLSAAAPYLIGLCITTANWFVQGILSGTAGTIPNEVTASILNVKDMGGTLGGNGFFTSIPGQLAEVIFPVIILCVVAFVTLALLVVAVLKQLALIALIVATPFACLSFVFPKWHGLFSMWCRGLVAITAIPVIQALLMRTGISMAEAIGSIQGVAAILAAAILAATFYGLLKVVTSFRTYVTGNKQSPLLNKGKQLAVGAGIAAATGGAGTVASLAASSAQGAASGGKAAGRAGFKGADNLTSGRLGAGAGAAGGSLRGVGNFASNAAHKAGDAGKLAANTKAGQGARSVARGTGRAIGAGRELGQDYGEMGQKLAVKHDKNARHRTSIIPKSGDGALGAAAGFHGRDRTRNGEGNIGDMLRQQAEEKEATQQAAREEKEAAQQAEGQENKKTKASTTVVGKFRQARNPQQASMQSVGGVAAGDSAPSAPTPSPVIIPSAHNTRQAPSSDNIRPVGSAPQAPSSAPQAPSSAPQAPSSAPPTPAGARSSGGPAPAKSDQEKVIVESARRSKPAPSGGSPIGGKSGSSKQ